MIIKDLKTLKGFFKEKIKTPIFGVGVNAFNRLGPEDFIPQYQLLSLYDSQDTRLIEKEIPVFSLEREVGREIRLRWKRNSTSVILHPKTREYLAELPSPLLIPYKSSAEMVSFCQKNNWRLAANHPSLGKGLIEDKVKFRRILRKIGVPVPPGEIISFGKLNFYELRDKYGLPFVVQYPLSGGGKGTFFINNSRELKAAKSSLIALTKGRISDNQEMVVSRFVRGPSPSVTGCVTRWGIFSTSPQHQVLSMKELYRRPAGGGLFCGHDWSFSRFSPSVYRQAKKAVEKTGQYLRDIGYRGIFGLDFIMDEKTKKLYVVECNPRLLGSFPVLTMAQIGNGEPPILAFHILEFLGAEAFIDVRAVNKRMAAEKRGAQMLLHNLEGADAQVTASVEPGVYRIEEKKLRYLRPGYKLGHLRNEEEFIITGGVLPSGEWVGANRRLCRVLTLAPVLSSYRDLNSWAKRIVRLVYQAFALKPLPSKKSKSD